MSKRGGGGGSRLLFSTVDVASGPTVGLTGGRLSDPPAPEAGLFPDDDMSSESSSIGPSSSDEEVDQGRGSDGQDEAESKPKASDGSSSSSLSTLSSLEDSLPFKKGLSDHFIGKSRSFSDLSACANGNAGDIAKPENLFNKRRRLVIASRFSYKRRASYSSLVTHPHPLLSPEHTLQEGEEDEEEKNDDDANGKVLDPTPNAVQFYREKKSKNTLKSPRSLPLFDLRFV